MRPEVRTIPYIANRCHIICLFFKVRFLLVNCGMCNHCTCTCNAFRACLHNKTHLRQSVFKFQWMRARVCDDMSGDEGSRVCGNLCNVVICDAPKLCRYFSLSLSLCNRCFDSSGDGLLASGLKNQQESAMACDHTITVSRQWFSIFRPVQASRQSARMRAVETPCLCVFAACRYKMFLSRNFHLTTLPQNNM